jgi:DNA-binding winged helix-turn-helix (wHTH) protein
VQYQFLDLHIDLDTQLVTRGQCKLDVNGLNFKLLAFLLSKNTFVAGIDEIIHSVWAPAIVNNDTVTQRV